MNPNLRSLKIIDRLIFIFFIVFLLSLTNSIFVNQVGYFGSLILILIRYFVTKDNQFEKTGLELALLLFVLAEFLSAVFSDYSAPAFTNVLKRSLLIPIIYTTVVASVDLNRAQLFFKVYIGASLISVCLYLFFAYRHYLENLYGLTESGPSIFQYPITASEIMSFTVVFLFAFVLHEKTNFKTKLFLVFAFLLSMTALLSTYKRTGWIGAAFGILIILIFKKQWKILIAGIAILLIFVLLEKNESYLEIADYKYNQIILSAEMSTSGRASDVYPDNDNIIVLSDYENGLVTMRDTSIISRLQTPAPVVSFFMWSDSFYLAQLIDSRFLLLKRKNNQLNITSEFISPGFTVDYKVSNGLLYVIDRDSGLTVFKNPNSLADTMRIRELKNQYSIFADSSVLLFYSSDGTILTIDLVNFLPLGKRYSQKYSESFDRIYYTNEKLLGFNNKGVKSFDLSDNVMKLIGEEKRISKAHEIYSDGYKVFVTTTDAKLFEINIASAGKIQIISENEIGFIPNSFCYHNGRLIFTKVKTSRLLSMFDPYNTTNLVRLALWRGGIEIFKDYPLFGVGDISLENYYRLYKQPYDKEIHGHLHNNFFHVLATLGLFGLIIVCFLFFRILQINIKIYNIVQKEKFISSYALGVIGAFCAFLASGLTELNFSDHEIVTLVWFTFGLNAAFFNLYMKQQNSD